MTHVTVTIGGRVYRLACNEGEEPHLETLAREVDGKIQEIRNSFGEIGDQRLVVMAALTIADELSEARRSIAELERQVAASADLESAARREAEHREALAAEALGEASHRIESLAAALAQAAKG
ncbi:MAG: cell division protein ZapA [Roseiarcus sp.]